MGKLNLVETICQEVGSAVKGKEDIIRKVLIAILAKGHILIEDIPGVGKTTLAIAFSKVMSLEYHRMQFTPDVLPSDVIGFNILNKNGTFEYKPGAILCNLFLADEINRTSSKTQSALLEVMEEGKVTVDGVTRELPKPFTVIATQNPSGSAGTQMLPESQLDRFMIRLSMGYPQIHQEVIIMRERQGYNPIENLRKIVSENEILQMQQYVEQVFVSDEILYYIAELSKRTREHSMISLGISPRGTLAILHMVKARAFVSGRDYVLPEDIKEIFFDVAGHRILLNSKAKLNHLSAEEVLEQILQKTNVPKVG